ncbi:HGGxSTG domain-containing protein [Tsuneonella litorea]|uniref:HGGxSTG domain-containing protein n=1 Tax=Tsuneonella litorea TaxID=2976475 RepID=UPI0035CD136F
MKAAPRCGAKTRRGTPCQSPAVSGKARCRMHGGAKGSGAPRGNQNAYIHGAYSREAREWDRAFAEMHRKLKDALRSF